MKKTTILLVVLAISTSCVQSQWFSKVKGNGNVISKTRNVEEYDKISVAGNFDITLIKGTEGKLEIKIEDNLLEHLVTEVVNGKLKIKWEKGINVRSYKGIKIRIPFTDIEAVTLAGSSDIVGNDIIKTSNFYAGVSGSGNIELNVQADELSSKITGSGNITLNGTTKILTVSVTGSGNFHGYYLASENVIAKVTGSGDIDVEASQELNAKITGSGDISYKGNPEMLDAKVTGSGSISKR